MKNLAERLKDPKGEILFYITWRERRSQQGSCQRKRSLESQEPPMGTSLSSVRLSSLSIWNTTTFPQRDVRHLLRKSHPQLEMGLRLTRSRRKIQRETSIKTKWLLLCNLMLQETMILTSDFLLRTCQKMSDAMQRTTDSPNNINL